MRRGIGIMVMVIVFCFIPRSGYAALRDAWGWDNKLVAFFTISGKWTVDDSDIDCEVGHRLDIVGPRAVCTMPDEKWSGTFEIFSGVLPPGLTLNESTGNISGIPTERGHWIVTMQLSDASVCDAVDGTGFTQELRFHITGTGKVIE